MLLGISQVVLEVTDGAVGSVQAASTSASASAAIDLQAPGTIEAANLQDSLPAADKSASAIINLQVSNRFDHRSLPSVRNFSYDFHS